MRNLSYGHVFDLQDNECAGKTHFHIKGCVPGLVLKQREKVTRKWRIDFILFVYETENSDTDAAIYSEDDGVSSKDNGGKINDNDDDDNERDDDNDDDDDGQDSDASGPISSFLRDLTYDSLTLEDDVRDDESVPMKNDTYTVSELEHYIEGKEVRDSETEGSVSDHDVSMEKLQVEIPDLQNKCGNSKKRTCNATFLVDKSKSNPFSTHQGLSQFYKKPVSVVQPITLSGAKLSGKTSPSKEDYLINAECSESDLAQAALCSRNKIALALAEMIKGKQPHVKPSQVVSAESTCHTGGETEPYSSDEEESCSTNTSSEGPCYRFGGTGIKKNLKGDKINRGQIRASNMPLVNSESKVLGSETQQPVCYNKEHQGPTVRRTSLKLTPSFMNDFTKYSPHSIKLKNSNGDIQKVTSLPIKRKSAPLCKLGEPVKSDGQGTNFSGGVKGSPIMSPGSKALGTPSRHHSHPLPPLVQSLVSPAQHPSCSDSKTRRRSSQVLKVRKDTEEYDSKGACREFHKESCVTRFEKSGTFLKTSWFTTQLASRTSSPDEMTGANYSKQSQFFKTEDLITMSRESQVTNCNISSSPVSSHQTSNALLIRGKAVCIEKGDSCSTVNENRRDRRLSCSKTNISPTKGNSRPKFCPSSAISSKNSSDNRSREFDMTDGGVRLSKNIETAEEQDDGLSELNCKRKLLEISKPFRTRANKKRLPDNRAGLRSTDRATKTSKKDASSTSGSSKNSIILPCGLGSNNSPLGSNTRKRRAKESVAMDTEDSLPKKHAKRGSPLSGYLNQRLVKNTASSQAFGCWGRESTPMKGKKVESLRLERFPHQNSNLMSPIRRASGDPCGTMNEAVVSPCKGLGSCDKSFCFDCC